MKTKQSIEEMVRDLSKAPNVISKSRLREAILQAHAQGISHSIQADEVLREEGRQAERERILEIINTKINGRDITIYELGDMLEAIQNPNTNS